MGRNLGGREYLVKKLGELGLSRRRSLRVLNHFFREIKRSLARGEEVEFAGGRLVRVDPASLSRGNYTEENWPAHWPRWTVVWVPHWEMLKSCLGPEEAQLRSADWIFDDVFVKELEADYRAARRRAAEERKAGRQKFGKARKRKRLTGK